MRVWLPPSEKLALTVNLAQRPIVCHGRLNTLMDISCLSEVFLRANNLFCSLKFQMVLRKEDGPKTPNFEFHFMTHENTFLSFRFVFREEIVFLLKACCTFFLYATMD